MADNNDVQQKRSIADLYKYLMKKGFENAAEVCPKLPEDLLQRISPHNDTVFHIAAHSKQKDLVLQLLKMLPAYPNHQLSDIQNNDGNTILHEVASSDTMKDVAEKVVEMHKDKDPKLLTARNNLGETPIFCAARYSQTEMFKFLAEKMKLKEGSEEDVKQHLQRNDKTTVLHISILAECFELANFIAENYSYLIKEKDQDSMTAFQYLACNPTVFGRKMRQGFMEELMISLDVSQYLKEIFKKWFPKSKSKTSDKRCSPKLQKLVKLLVEKDTSRCVSINSQATSQENQLQNSNKYKKSDETPLFLATISGIKEIVEEILHCHPEELKHTNREGMNILQVAILHRHIEIFDLVVDQVDEYRVLPRSLLLAIDDKGNSLLHMVGQKIKIQANERMQSSASQLRKELKFFEKVKSTCKMHVTKPLNNDHQTAEELFAASNEGIHQQATEWLMRTTENCTILSVFIATVAFAAAYTVPGGPDQSTGIPILNSNPFFVVFILADVISLTFALTSVGIFLSILTSSFPLQDFEKYLFQKLTLGIKFMVFSVSMMAVAFGATIVLSMCHEWENVLWNVVAFLPVPIFFLSYSPLRSAVLRSCTEPLKNFVAKFLRVVASVIVTFLFVLLLLLYGAFKGLYWTVKVTCVFIICKPVRWICGNESQTKCGTQSPQPTAAPPPEV